MGKEIKEPLKSEMCLGILNRVLVMDEPYPSAVADSLNQQFGNIQSYIDTMVKRGWLEKKKEGRKKLLRLNTWKIWQDSEHLEYLKLYTDEELNSLWDTNEETINSRLNELKEEELEEDLKKFLKNALEFKIRRALQDEQKPRGLSKSA